MKKFLAVLMLMLGLTFIYNPQTNSGFVYYNNVNENVIIIVDPSTNSMVYFRGVYFGTEGSNDGFDNWMKGKINKGLPFKSIIVPYRGK